MNGDKKVRLPGIGDGGPFFQRDVGVPVSGQDDLEGRFLFQDGRHLFCHGQDNILFLHAVHSQGAGVLAAVSRIDDNGFHAQPELLGQGGQVVRGFRLGAGDVNDHPERLFHGENLIILNRFGIKHDADRVRVKLGAPHLLQQPIPDGDRILKSGGDAAVLQVDIEPSGQFAFGLEKGLLELHGTRGLNDHPGIGFC